MKIFGALTSILFIIILTCFSAEAEDTDLPYNLSPSAVPDEQPNAGSPLPDDYINIREQSDNQLNPCESVRKEGATWLDILHSLLQEKSCIPAVWFDGFFGEERVLPDLRPGTFISFKKSARINEDGKISYADDFYLTLDLPKFEGFIKRARLYFDSGSEADKYTIHPGDVLQPGIDPETGETEPVVGLRVDSSIRPDSLVSLDTGVRIKNQPYAFARMRYQYTMAFSDFYLFRFSEIAMWRAVEHFSNTLQLDLERSIFADSIIRWGNSVTYTDDQPGIAWKTGVSLLSQLTFKSAISYDMSMWGVNHPDWTVQNYRIGSLYRRSIYRPWFFLEIEPEVTWPEDEQGRREAEYVLMSAVEIQFGN